MTSNFNLCDDDSCEQKLSDSVTVTGGGVGEGRETEYRAAQSQAKHRALTNAKEDAKKKYQSRLQDPPDCDEGCESFGIIEEEILPGGYHINNMDDPLWAGKCFHIKTEPSIIGNERIYNSEFKCIIKVRARRTRICITKSTNQCIEDEENFLIEK